MDQEKKDLVNQCVQEVVKHLPDVVGIYLFGSFGTEYEMPQSDIDLAVLCKEAIDPVALWNIAQEVRIAVGRDVDLIDLKQASTVLRYQVVASGARIFCKDRTLCDHTETTYLSMYLRFNEERKELLAERRGDG